MSQKINKLQCLTMAAFSLASFGVLGQAIVNIEDLRREGQVGFFANITASLDASRGNRDRDFSSIQLRFDNNSDETESFLILQESKRKSNGKPIDNSTFMHGRYVFIGDNLINWEIFAQYSENPFRNYNKRSVLGGGIRYELTPTARLGAGILQEDEVNLANQSKTTERLGFYLHNAFEIAENIYLQPTIYFQPSLNDFENDYKASMILALNFKVNEDFIIEMQYSSSHDSDPPLLAEKADESISTRFSYDLSRLWKD